MGRNRNPSALLVGTQTLWEMVRSFFQKLEVEFPYGPAISLLGVPPHPQTKLRSGRDTCIPILTAVLFVIAKAWEEAKSRPIIGKCCVTAGGTKYGDAARHRPERLPQLGKPCHRFAVSLIHTRPAVAHQHKVPVRPQMSQNDPSRGAGGPLSDLDSGRSIRRRKRRPRRRQPSSGIEHARWYAVPGSPGPSPDPTGIFCSFIMTAKQNPASLPVGLRPQTGPPLPRPVCTLAIKFPLLCFTLTPP